MRFLFGDGYVLDEERRELHRAGRLIAVEPQVFDLLVLLLRSRGHVVSRDMMIEVVWGGRIVSESTLSSRINAARRAINDTGETQHLIRTVARRGFLFVGDVAEQAEHTAVPLTRSVRQDVTFRRSSDGVTLAIATAGEGPTLVRAGTWLTHVEKDWTSPIWSPFLQALAGRSRLVRYDSRGNGLSDRDVTDISFEALVRDLEAVTEGLGRFALFGASQGAAVSVAFAAAHPDRVSRLILSGAYARGRNRRSQPVEREKAQALMTLMRQGWGDPRSAFMQAFSSVYLPGGTPEQIRWWTDLQRLTTSAEMAIRFREVFDEIDVTDLLPTLHLPTLVLHSRGDTVAPFDEGRRLAAAVPGARFVELDSDNHVVLEGEPAWSRMLDEIARFLAD
ncbi:alpha/beta fold hydrolase [Roseomonas sp. HF4]|uniref:alpha/beta fold hydrolase n=1 Tax=Roseomonas sp. HF4 TaxID=2562313 RepID=UPI0010C133E1|nr:alpha/beta fold hydrolase [Roseomonas sp. HF4]